MSAAITVVTGTDTGVGKTIVTAALAAAHRAAGRRVAVVKPVQTGVGPAGRSIEPVAASDIADPVGISDTADPVGMSDTADADVVARLAGVPVHEFVRLAAPLAPDTAARLEGTRLPGIRDHAARIAALVPDHDEVLVEGAGGVLVRLDSDGGTVLDLARALDAPLLVVARAGLGTLNHTELTVRAARHAGIWVAALVIGAWPANPGPAERSNLDDLPRVCGVPLGGAVPAGAGDRCPAEFRAGAVGWLRLPARV